MIDYLNEDKENLKVVDALNSLILTTVRKLDKLNNPKEQGGIPPDKIYNEMKYYRGSILMGPMIKIKLLEDKDFYFKLITNMYNDEIHILLRLEQSNKGILSGNIERSLRSVFGNNKNFKINKDTLILKLDTFRKFKNVDKQSFFDNILLLLNEFKNYQVTADIIDEI